MNLRQLALVGLAALALGGTAVAQAVPPPSAAVTPPPPPAPNGNAATPGTLIGTPAPQAAPSLNVTIAPAPAASASAAPAGRRGRRAATPEPAASASESPEPPQFQTMDGVWEVQLQPMNNGGRAVYSHLYVTQKADQLSGTWIRADKSKLEFTGTFDGRLFKLALKGGTQTYTMSGYAENFGDMVGLLTTADPKDRGTPFTASHRKKDKIV